MSEVEDALKGYYAAVESSDLSQSSQASYIDMANNFVRWLRGDFDPGSRKGSVQSAENDGREVQRFKVFGIPP
jgi:hypothetical protein